MKKKILMRCLFGAPLGLTISTMITIVISMSVGNGTFYSVVPELVSDCGTELNAVILQTLCSLLYGAAWAGASIIWDHEHWSILHQTGIHFIVCSLATFPIAYFMHWMSHSVSGVLAYFGVFIGIYLIIWVSQYFTIKKRIEKMNEKVRENNTNIE